MKSIRFGYFAAAEGIGKTDWSAQAAPPLPETVKNSQTFIASRKRKNKIWEVSRREARIPKLNNNLGIMNVKKFFDFRFNGNFAWRFLLRILSRFFFYTLAKIKSRKLGANQQIISYCNSIAVYGSLLFLRDLFGEWNNSEGVFQLPLFHAILTWLFIEPNNWRELNVEHSCHAACDSRICTEISLPVTSTRSWEQIKL